MNTDNTLLNTHSASEEHQIRIEKVKALRAAGIEPWPANKPIDACTTDIPSEFKDDQESRTYTLAGRIITLRKHGKSTFATMQDSHGTLQIFIKSDLIGTDKFDLFDKFIDIGDIVWVTGPSFKTKTGEITLRVLDFTLESKSLHPLPDKFHGIADVEIRYRQRYLDLISSIENKNRFIKRSLIIRSMRNFFDNHGYLEVETPMLHPIPGGAAAKPFVTHHNALSTDLYMRIAPELYLKRLVVGGFERVYEINRNFRNEGISTRHNPEFTMVEFYTAYQDYHWVMNFVDNLIKQSITDAGLDFVLPFGQHTLDFAPPFAQLTMRDAVMQYGKFTAHEIEGAAIDTVIAKHHVKVVNKNASWGEKLYACFEHFVEPNLIQPTFITEFPIEVSPLAKRDPQNPAIASRFELFIAGMELSNGFNELNDPFDQAQRFKEQASARTAGDAEAHHYDADFIQALEYGLPPTVGVGIGIDRLVMLLTNTTSIKDVILFPTLKKRD